jgi:16S rRNA (uracil1498-N3)-methyltransferase
MPRFFCPLPLTAGQAIELPTGAARHVQVLRMQPGDGLTLFNGEGGEFDATVTRMGRSDVAVQLGAHHTVEREAPVAVHLAVGMPANERMDWLVEKATELGAASVQPLLTAHTVLRLKGERADKKQAHWQSVAVAACEQCGRNRVPVIYPVRELHDWLATPHLHSERRGVLSLAPGAMSASAWVASQPASQLPAPVWLLHGPEGGLSPDEEQAAIRAEWQPLSLGPRVLRAETAALAALCVWTLG